ncbi:uncharacterized protein LOC142235621 [Haematobia irritans]|uniref:uncharacterized protein LOC142235621 n=1 Tax=Haematobia irritans TaxID=7368 RepID=UPI003F4F61B3
MGNLPADRLRALRPFLIVGIDFCGPVNVFLRIRGRPPLKMYLAVFDCFTSKAIHIELVSDLATEAFILSFKRFSARRGLPSKVYWDNATNFVGASRAIQERYQAFVKDKEAIEFYGASQSRIHIHSSQTPYSGGLWKAAVKQAKFLILPEIGNVSLTQEEMETMRAEVEAVINSRPIAPLSPDPNDGEVLTPANLLIGEGLRSLPPDCAGEDSSKKVTCLRRWRMLCD